MPKNQTDKKGKGPEEINHYVGLITLAVLILFFWVTLRKSKAEEGDGYLGILNANPALIDSVSNQSGTLTGDFSTRSIVGPTEHAQWLTDGPVVISKDGAVLGTLSTLETSTTSLFNETILEQVHYMDRCEACIGSLNDSFSTEGPKIYDSQSAELKEKIGELIGEPMQESP